MTRIRSRARAALAALGALVADMAAAAREAFRPGPDLAPYVARLESAANRLEVAADHLAAALIVADVLAEIGGAL
jgi:hypothetical protein